MVSAPSPAPHPPQQLARTSQGSSLKVGWLLLPVGPLFNFDVHDDVRLLSDATVGKDEVQGCRGAWPGEGGAVDGREVEEKSGPGEYHAKRKKPVRERQVSHDLTHMWNLMDNIN